MSPNLWMTNDLVLIQEHWFLQDNLALLNIRADFYAFGISDSRDSIDSSSSTIYGGMESGTLIASSQPMSICLIMVAVKRSWH